MRRRVKKQGRKIRKLIRRVDRNADYSPYVNDPVGFTRDVLHVTFTPSQEEASRLLLVPPYRVLVPSANEQGKTFFAACVVIWWHCTRRPSIIITTAPKADQVKKLLWKEIRRISGNAKLNLPFQPKACHIERASDDFATGVTARDATSFQGHHGPSQLFCFDEATAIEPGFWEATESMFSPPGHAWLCIFNPTETGSQAFVEMMKGGWHVVRMSAVDHPNIAAELKGLAPPVPHAMRLAKFERLLKQWSQLVGGDDERTVKGTDLLWPPKWAVEHCQRTGQRSRWWRPGPLAESRLLGRYPSQGINSVWSEGDWMSALREGRDPLPVNLRDYPEIGGDIARYGDDSTEFHVRIGFVSLHHESASKQSTVVTAERLMELAKHYATWWNVRNRERPESEHVPLITGKDIPIKVDDSGVGGGVTDMLQAHGYNVVPVNSSSVAHDPGGYPNVRSELWFTTSEMAKDEELDLSALPDDVVTELRRQALAVTWSLDSRGRRVVCPKDDMKKLLGRSPDGMDAMNLAYSSAGLTEAPVIAGERDHPLLGKRSERRGR